MTFSLLFSLSIHTHTHTHGALLTSWLLLLGLLSDSLTRDDLMSARSPSSSEWLSSAKICSLCGSPSSLNGIISSVAHSSGSPPPPPPDNWGMLSLFLGYGPVVSSKTRAGGQTHTPALSVKLHNTRELPAKLPPGNKLGKRPPFSPLQAKRRQ